MQKKIIRIAPPMIFFRELPKQNENLNLNIDIIENTFSWNTKTSFTLSALSKDIGILYDIQECVQPVMDYKLLGMKE